jgi:hypothetical protein
MDFQIFGGKAPTICSLGKHGKEIYLERIQFYQSEN